MIGYVMFILFLAGIFYAFGARITPIIILVCGTYLGAFIVFKEHGIFIIMYRAMVWFAVFVAVVWIVKAIVKGCAKEPPEPIDLHERAVAALKLGGCVAVYEMFMVMIGGSSDNEFGFFSIMTLVGDAGFLKGILIFCISGAVIGMVAIILEEIIVRMLYAQRNGGQAGDLNSDRKLFKTKVVYTDLVITDGVVQHFEGMEFHKLPEKVKRVEYPDGTAWRRYGDGWIYLEDSASYGYSQDTED